MVNVILAWMLDQAVVEKEIYEGRIKAKAELMKQFGQIVTSDVSDVAKTSSLPAIVYDEFGKPRPVSMAYDIQESDVQPVFDSDKDVASDDDNPFPGLSRPLG